jgi:hypothetical protein
MNPPQQNVRLPRGGTMTQVMENPAGYEPPAPARANENDAVAELQWMNQRKPLMPYPGIVDVLGEIRETQWNRPEGRGIAEHQYVREYNNATRNEAAAILNLLQQRGYQQFKRFYGDLDDETREYLVDTLSIYAPDIKQRLDQEYEQQRNNYYQDLRSRVRGSDVIDPSLAEEMQEFGRGVDYPN